MNKTAKTLTLAGIALAAGLTLTNCAKDGNKKNSNPLSPSVSPSTAIDWNTASIEKLLSPSVQDVEVDISVLGDYDLNTTTVKVDGIETSNYNIEMIDQMYKVTLRLPVGNFEIKVSDSDDKSYEKRNVKVKAEYTKDIFNTQTDFLANNTYKNDAYATNAQLVGNSKAVQMLTDALSSLSADAQTIINGILDNSNVHIGKDNIEKAVIGNQYLSIQDKQGRYHVLDIEKTDVDKIRNYM